MKNNRPLTCIIADDEPIAREGLAEHVARTEGLECAAMCRDAAELAECLKGIRPDILFLDIRMPGMSGIDFLKSGSVPGAVVIVTAYPQYALQGFDLDVADYLVKPVSFARFSRAVAKIRESGADSASITVRADKTIHRLRESGMTMLEAMENYVRIHTDTETLTVRATLKSILAQLDAGRFVRVHKSFAVNAGRVATLSPDRLMLDNGQGCPVSRNGYRELVQMMDRPPAGRNQ